MNKTKRFMRLFVMLNILLLVVVSVAGCGTKKGEKAKSSNDNFGTYNIRISSCNSADHPQTLGLLAMKKYVEDKTDGKLTVSVFTNGQLGDELESIGQVQDGIIEMATASISPVSTFQEKFSVLEIPFMYDDYQHAWATLDSKVGTDLMATLEEVGLKGLAYMENGFRHATNSIKPIKTLSDFKGLKIRTMESPMHMANFKALGANPTPVPFSELYMAMSQKIVDGQENPLANIWEVKLYEVQKYVSLTGHLYDPMPLITNLEWFESLPEDYQEIISVGAILGQNYSRFVNAAREEIIITKLREKGVEVNDLTKEAKEEINNVSTPVITEKVKENLGDEFVDQFIAGVDAVKADIVKSVE